MMTDNWEGDLARSGTKWNDPMHQKTVIMGGSAARFVSEIPTPVSAMTNGAVLPLIYSRALTRCSCLKLTPLMAGTLRRHESKELKVKGENTQWRVEIFV